MAEEIFTDKSKMPFGQYKDYPLVSVPASYLLFLLDAGRAGRIKDYITANKDVLVKQAGKEKKKR
jgi:uncharacterized protein (DUF3820 family)